MKKLIACLLVLSAPICAVAAPCDVNKGDEINGKYGLCNTHAYNVALAENPTDYMQASQMNEAVRLKSTLMVQELKRQYDYLEITARQFKIQLQKAALLTSDNSGGGGGSSGPLSSNYGTSSAATGAGGGLADAEDCGAKSTPISQVECVYKNLSVINTATNNGTRMTASVQKQIDIYVGLVNGMKTGNTEIKIDDCARLTQNNLKTCISNIRVQTSNYIEARNSRQFNTNNNR